MKLKDAGVNVDLGMNYTKKLEFNIVPGGSRAEELMNAMRTLWEDSLQVITQIQNLLNVDLKDVKLIDLLQSIKNNIEKLQIKITGTNRLANPNEFAKEHNQSSLKKIYNTLSRLHEQYANQLTNEFNEFSTHFQDRYKTLQSLLDQQDQQEKTKKYKIRKSKIFSN